MIFDVIMPKQNAFVILIALRKVWVVLLLPGCAGSPDLVIAGAYFPAWLICCVIAAVSALVLHGVLLVSPWRNTWPLQLSLCGALGAVAGALVWLYWIGFQS